MNEKIVKLALELLIDKAKTMLEHIPEKQGRWNKMSPAKQAKVAAALKRGHAKWQKRQKHDKTIKRTIHAAA